MCKTIAWWSENHTGRFLTETSLMFVNATSRIAPSSCVGSDTNCGIANACLAQLCASCWTLLQALIVDTFSVFLVYWCKVYLQHLTLPLMAVTKICKKCKNIIHVIYYLLCNWFPQLLSVCHSTSITSQDCFWKWFEIHVLLSRYLLIYSYI